MMCELYTGAGWCGEPVAVALFVALLSGIVALVAFHRLEHVRRQLDALEAERKYRKPLPARMASLLAAYQAELDKCRALLQDAWKALHK